MGDARETFLDGLATLKLATPTLQSVQRFFDAVECIAVLTDSSGRLLCFNKAAERATGYKRIEAVGKNLLELLVPTDWIPVVTRRFADPSASAVRERHSNPWLTKTGDEILIEWFCRPVSIGGIGGLCIVGAGEIMAEERRLQA
jgi:PAS domain S-box-containing protein